jgi:superfamily II DNA or RNA helicase
VTATPVRGDGRGLGGIFEVLIECPQVAELIELGHLVGTRVYAPSSPDLAGVQVKRGDSVESQLAEAMDRPKLVGDIVTHWWKYSERRKTVAFAVDVRHSIHLRDEFIRAGVRAEHIDGNTPKDERDATLARLASGEIELVTNCMVLTEGWDMPEVGCCILARPTRKMGLYRQMLGRVLRPAPGKKDAIILDHSGAVFRHGFAEDPIEWTLDPDRLIKPAMTEVIALGFVVRTKEGIASPGRGRRPNTFLLTYLLQADGSPPTDDWRHISRQDAILIAARRGHKPNGSTHRPPKQHARKTKPHPSAN